MAKVKVYKEHDSSQPKFPDDFKVLKKAVLQVTDIKTNRNKYYAVELHEGGNKFRVFTHYGRTDDLETNPNAGVKECRYCDAVSEAQALYDSIYKQKTSARKGYKEVNLASSKIGSSKSVGQSSGHVDERTLEKMSAPKKKVSKKVTKKLLTDKSIISLVEHLYAEATNALVNTVNATITANGIETPLGVLTMGQIDKGQDILKELAKLNEKKKQTQKIKDDIIDLSGQFYTVIPHKIGRSRTAIEASVINTQAHFDQKQETLQLMRDMLNVSGDDASVLVDPEIDKKYKALGCTIEKCSLSEIKEMTDYIVNSQVKRFRKLKVKNIWKVCRPSERKVFKSDIKNQKLLFHGSAGKNWVGILSRGLLMPKLVVKLGVSRTDGGWLGNGIYFGDAACTTYTYTYPGKRGTRFMTVARVALGKEKIYKKITYGLNSPPPGYDSCHGDPTGGSQFQDHEFVIYDEKQHQQEYLVEYI